MNYLAHSFLSPVDPPVLLGNIWGDLIRPKDYEEIHADVLQGVLQHKSIDAFTDQHAGVDQIIKLIRPFQGKYTPVVTDVIMDFILSKYWTSFHNESLEQYCGKIYKTISKYLDLIPQRLHPRINRMLEHRWLESCANRERMESTLWMLSKRASFENKIPEAMLPYDIHVERVDGLFLTFFEELRTFLTLRNEGLS